MKPLLLKLMQKVFGYCLKHHLYGRPCVGCYIDEYLNHPDRKGAR